jgi:hypothetical protein
LRRRATRKRTCVQPPPRALIHTHTPTVSPGLAAQQEDRNGCKEEGPEEEDQEEGR